MKRLPLWSRRRKTPTAPHRIGARVIKDMDEQFDRTPLPVPRPFGGDLSVREYGGRRSTRVDAGNGELPAHKNGTERRRNKIPRKLRRNECCGMTRFVPSSEAPLKAAKHGKMSSCA